MNEIGAFLLGLISTRLNCIVLCFFFIMHVSKKIYSTFVYILALGLLGLVIDFVCFTCSSNVLHVFVCLFLFVFFLVNALNFD